MIILLASHFQSFVDCPYKRPALTFTQQWHPLDLLELGRPLPNPECVVTVGIAAIVEAQNLIVTASDRMLSSNDVVQARDNAALKARKISSTWGIMFAGNGELFIPFAEQALGNMSKLGS